MVNAGFKMAAVCRFEKLIIFKSLGIFIFNSSQITYVETASSSTHAKIASGLSARCSKFFISVLLFSLSVSHFIIKLLF